MHHGDHHHPRAGPLPGRAGLRRGGRPILDRLRPRHRLWQGPLGRRVADRLAAARRLCELRRRRERRQRARPGGPGRRCAREIVAARRRRAPRSATSTSSRSGSAPWWSSPGPAANFLLSIALFAVLFGTLGEVDRASATVRASRPGPPGGAGRIPGRRPDRRRRRPYASTGSRICTSTSSYRAGVRDRLHRSTAPDGCIDLVATPAEREIESVIGGARPAGSSASIRVARAAAGRPLRPDLRGRRVARAEDLGRVATTGFYLGRLVTGQVRPGPAARHRRHRPRLAAVIAKQAVERGAARSRRAGPRRAGQHARAWPPLLSVSIGFLNLLPIPVLDGGHLLFYAYEACRTAATWRRQFRRPATGLGLLCCVGLMLFATRNDLQLQKMFHFLGAPVLLKSKSHRLVMTQPMTKIPRPLRRAVFRCGACADRGRRRCSPRRIWPLAQSVSRDAAWSARIVVQGNERIERETILSYLPIQVGDTVDAAQLDLALKTLFPHRPVLRRRASSCRAATWWCAVVENPIINQVVFEGNPNIKEDKLKDEVQVRPRGIFTKAKVQAGRPADRRALPPLGPHLGHRHAQDRPAAAEARRPDLRDQRGPQERHPARSTSSATSSSPTTTCAT